MRRAILSDVHGNLEALSAVLFDIESLNIDDIICLGDIVGYGPNPKECITLIDQTCSISLLGNHDAVVLDILSTQNFNVNAKIAIDWTEKQLTQKAKQFLKNLPISKVTGDCTFVHATPFEPNLWHYIGSVDEAKFNFKFFETIFCFIGHTHIPVIISRAGKNNVQVTLDGFLDYSNAIDTKFIINVGSVGQPRDRNSKASYGIFDTDACTFQLRRVEYDVEKCQKKMAQHKLPEFLINRLSEGK